MMQSLSDRFLDAIATERQRMRSRRGFLVDGAKVAGGGILGLSAAASPLGGLLPTTLAQDFEDDLDILNYALTLEHLEYAFYRDGLDEFGQEGFASSNRPSTVFGLLEEIRGHEQAHVEALTQTILDLGGEPVEEAEYDFGYDDVGGFLEVAMALENTGVAAYAGAASSISDDGVLAAALGIHSVEARHAAYLNARNGVSPFPDAVDEALTRDEVLDIAGPLIVSNGESAPSGASNEAGEDAATVDIDQFAFRPNELEITVGTTVTWTNQEAIPHTATAEDGSFDSDTLGDGDSFSYTFDEPGAYAYVCTFHDNMTGTVIVT